MPKPWIDFTALRSRAGFEPVLAHYGLLPTGRPPQVTISCPFHDEAKPSCKVNLEKRAFHCFGCGAKGNVLDFVAKMEHLKNPGELPEAARKLAEICGIPLKEVSRAPDASNQARVPAYSTEVGRRFRSKSATCSNRSRPGIPLKPAGVASSAE